MSSDLETETISLLNAVIESTADGILVVDRAGRIVHFNQIFVKMWQIPDFIIATRDDDQAIAFVLDQLKYPELFVSKVRELYGQADAISYDTLEFKDGKVFERFSRPQKLGHEYVGRVWSFRDVTEREALLERERRTRAHAEEAAKMRDELMAMVSHDLKNPLSSILAAVNLIQKAAGLDQQCTKALIMIQRSVDHMRRMIQDLLDAHMTEAGGYRVKVKEERRLCNTLGIVKNAIELQQTLASEKKIQLEICIPEDLPMLLVHERLMGQVFQNLIGNAVKFTHPGGVIRVRAEIKESEVIFSIQDTGPGIEPSLLPILFGRFMQARETAQSGNGLGLVIAKGIIEAHGGKIWVESQAGIGTTFFFSLPKGSQVIS